MMKTCLVHDDFVQEGGAENLFAAIASIWPNAPIYTSLVDWNKLPESIIRDRIISSFIQKISFSAKFHKLLLPLYPFADLDFYTVPKVHNWQLKSKNYFLIVTRLVRWKKVELAIDALAKSNSSLIIAGDGPDKKRLESIAKNGKVSVQFEGRVEKEKLKVLYQNARALIVTQEEDFGISMVEAQACGIPVIAYGKGGQKEIVLEAKTGLFFENQSAQSLKDAIKYFSGLKWSFFAGVQGHACGLQAARVNLNNFSC